MFYKYLLEYNEYEDSFTVELTHTTKFSKEEFKNILLEATQKHINQEAKDDFYTQCYQSRFFTDDLNTGIKDILINDYGFKEPPEDYTVKLSFGYGEDEEWIRKKVKRPIQECTECDNKRLHKNDPKLLDWSLKTYCIQRDHTKWGKRDL